MWYTYSDTVSDVVVILEEKMGVGIVYMCKNSRATERQQNNKRDRELGSSDPGNDGMISHFRRQQSLI